MSQEHRQRAQQQLANLLEVLRASPDQQEVAPLIALVTQLDRAVATFHMEAIRFRMYTLGRQIHRSATPLPAEVSLLYEEVRASLEAAGFHTRSVTG